MLSCYQAMIVCLLLLTLLVSSFARPFHFEQTYPTNNTTTRTNGTGRKMPTRMTFEYKISCKYVSTIANELKMPTRMIFSFEKPHRINVTRTEDCVNKPVLSTEITFHLDQPYPTHNVFTMRNCVKKAVMPRRLIFRLEQPYPTDNAIMIGNYLQKAVMPIRGNVISKELKQDQATSSEAYEHCTTATKTVWPARLHCNLGSLRGHEFQLCGTKLKLPQTSQVAAQSCGPDCFSCAGERKYLSPAHLKTLWPTRLTTAAVNINHTRLVLCRSLCVHEHRYHVYMNLKEIVVLSIYCFQISVLYGYTSAFLGELQNVRDPRYDNY